MKSILALIIVAAWQLSVFAQGEGIIHYDETVKMDIQLENIPEALKDLIPTSQRFSKELLFVSGRSLYRTKQGDLPEDLDMESDNGTVKVMFMQDETEDILYSSMETGQLIHQKGIMGKSFIVESNIEKFAWKLTDEKVMYLDYECQKAVIENQDEFVVAWFTSQIPAQIGPGSYSGLPGAILMLSLNDGELEIKATSIELKELEDDAIMIPGNGKKVSKEEYDRISEEKIKELEQMMGGKSIKIGRN